MSSLSKLPEFSSESGDHRFVIVAPMYNASATLTRFFASIVAQSYKNWYIILIDDISSRDEINREWQIISRWTQVIDDDYLPGNTSRLKVIWNDNKEWEVRNVLKGISLCSESDIICRVDPDDALVDTDAFFILNECYKSGVDAVWTQHRWGQSDRNISSYMPPGVDPYRFRWVSSHLKTFRKSLITGVPWDNFLNMNGDVVRRAGDQAIYLPVLYRTEKRLFLPRVMYSYTIDEMGGAVYETDDAKFQKSEADFIRSRGYISSGPTWEEKISI